MGNTINVDNKYFPALGKLFSPMVINSLVWKNYSPYLAEVCSNSGLLDKLDLSMTLGNFFNFIYDLLFKNYRNEYIFKNVIANKILLGKHSLNTSQLLMEFRAGKSKADVVLLNGTSTVYEIKSEYDSFSRLKKQIRSYCDVFDYINVITTNKQANKITSCLPEKVGILVLTERDTISTFRNPKSNKENIKLAILFNSLRKTEYTNIIKRYYGTIPDVPNTIIYKVCKELFCKIPVSTAHDLTINVLKRRSDVKILKDFIEKAPSSTIAYILTIGNQEKQMKTLISILNKELQDFIIPCNIER